MSNDKQSLGSVKRFGTRYGKTVKQRLANIEEKARQTYKCPYCRYKKVERQASGIWHCNKCDRTFTGKAYTVHEDITEDDEDATDEADEDET
jgi:large subunit ribosomal protein L37Ae